MKRFACGDIVPGCTAAWQFDDDEAPLGIVAVHATTPTACPSSPAR